MALVTTVDMFKKAYTGGYAIGAFNVNNMEIVQAITEAAAELNSPIILQASAGARKYAKPQYLKHLVEAAVELYPEIPIAMHLDHGADFEVCKDCVDGGFTSVMIDYSSHSFEENIEESRKVAEYAHERGAVVEAELGTLAGIEDAVSVAADKAMFTDPDHIRVEDPGKIEGNTVFTYLDAICSDEHFEKYYPEYKNLDELKAHYMRGGLGDVKVKKFLNSVLHDELEPIRQRRKEFEKDIPSVYDILKKGTEKARAVASKTLSEVRSAMKINYFEDEELIREQAEKYSEN